MSRTTDAALWSAAALELGEGPRWVDGRLVLVDILSGTLLTADGEHPGDLRRWCRVAEPLGAVAPVAGTPGQWIAAVGTGVALLTAAGGPDWQDGTAAAGTGMAPPTAGASLDWLDRTAAAGPVPRRMNDGVCDPAGRFWAGCMAWDARPGAGVLFRVDPDGSVLPVLDGLTIPNGPAFTADGRLMYLADSGRGIVLRYTVDPDSAGLTDATTFLRLDHGSPDGMTVDAEGNLWVAVWGGGEVHCYTPAGRLAHTVRVPAPQPTAPCLGGPDGTRLFITTARHGLDATTAGSSGSVFATDVAVPGLPVRPYRPAKGVRAVHPC
jgi:sugar lactone lactonase YvrE